MIEQKEETMTLSMVIESKDKLDSEIINSTLNMVVGLKLDDFIFTDKKLWENYFGKNLNLTKSLLKANDHYRKFLKEEKKVLKEHRKKSIKNPNKNIYLGTNSITLNTEIDGFLSQIKASLDTLATTLNPLLGLKLNGWHKNKGKSGIEIISALKNNLNDIQKEKAFDLIEIIENNIGWITYIVGLRDKVHHQGGLKCLTEIIYDYKYRKVVPQYILHPDGQKELVKDFLLRTIKGINIFIFQILAYSIIIKTPNGMAIKKNDEDKYPPYNWVILNSSANNKID